MIVDERSVLVPASACAELLALVDQGVAWARANGLRLAPTTLVAIGEMEIVAGRRRTESAAEAGRLPSPSAGGRPVDKSRTMRNVMSSTDAAAALGVSREAVAARCRAGSLRAQRGARGAWLVDGEHVAELARQKGSAA